MIRPHPQDRHNPERRAQVRDRFLSVLGGVAVTSVSALIQRSTTSEMTYENMKLTAIFGVAAIALPIVAELQERYRLKPDNGEGTEGYGGGPDDPPEDSPKGPQGPERELIGEIEAYLRENEPVLL